MLYKVKEEFFIDFFKKVSYMVSTQIVLFFNLPGAILL